MPPFRRVDDNKAGPTALGILVPPGKRTVVILRPRALPWDLLVGSQDQGAGLPHLRDFGRDEAAVIARQLFRNLEQQALETRDGLEVAANTSGTVFLVWLRQPDWVWLACPRRPGKPYEKMQFACLEEAEEAARKIAGFVCPASDAAQEVYFNTQHFSH